MSRYIDADALTWLVEEYKLAISTITEEQERDNRLPLQMLTEFENMISEQPTVDAVPVVRCRECKHRIMNDNYGEKGYFDLKAMCDLDTGDIFELGRYAEIDDWFCADGERRTDEQQT